jgi:hypothetical protein
MSEYSKKSNNRVSMSNMNIELLILKYIWQNGTIEIQVYDIKLLL